MERRIKIVFGYIFIITCFCCGQLSCKNTKTENYVGIDEISSIEIKLTLAPNQTFVLTKLFEDNKTEEHKKQENVTGNWIKEGKLLKLKTKDNIIVYELTTENSVIAGHEFNIETYVFKTNLKDFFASKIDLNLEKTN
jgi:hypothetical protein